MKSKGYEVLAETLKQCGIKDFFYLIGGPTTPVMEKCVELGIRGIDTRDERAGAFAAIAYSRLLQRPGLVIGSAGPGTTNLVPGLGHAYADASPLVAIGGSAPRHQRGMGAFQETDQLGLVRAVTKWCDQVLSPARIADSVMRAMEISRIGKPGPVYLDFPADIVFGEVDAMQAVVRDCTGELPRGGGDPRSISDAARLLKAARKPIVLAGSGVLWGTAWDELRAFIESTGIPVYTTPNARGLVPEDHALCPVAARSSAFRESDCVLVVGTRANYIVNFLQPPVFNADCKVIQLNVDSGDIGLNRRPDVAILADCKLALPQLATQLRSELVPGQFSEWTSYLQDKHSKASEAIQSAANDDRSPLHPLRLSVELNALLPRDRIVVVDGHEILGFSRRGIAAYLPGRTLSPGVYGTMGVGVPFGIGAKVAAPDAPVLVLTGDGAFGYHAVELETAVRHRLGIVVVISNNGGWTGQRGTPGRALPHSHYHRLAESLGAWGAVVDRPDELGPAVVEAFKVANRESRPALVNVMTAPERSQGRPFSQYAPI